RRLRPAEELLNDSLIGVIGAIEQVIAGSWNLAVEGLDESAAAQLLGDQKVIADGDTLSGDDGIDRMQLFPKGQLIELLEEGDRGILGAKRIQPPAPSRGVNSLGRPIPMDHRVESELMASSERFAFGQRTRVAQDEEFALKEFPGGQTGGRVRGPT